MEPPSPQPPRHFIYLPRLCSPVPCSQDVDEGLELLSKVVGDRIANLPHRFQLACFWTFITRGFRHPSVSAAYESPFLSLTRDPLLFAPTLRLQYVTLTTTCDYSHGIPPDYASYLIDLHQLENTIVTFESRRALLWSEVRRFNFSKQAQI